MEQIDLAAAVQTELGRLTMRALGAETALQAANARIHELEAELLTHTAVVNGSGEPAQALHD